MNLARIFAYAFVRRLAYLAVAVLLGYASTFAACGRAEARTYAEAYALCDAATGFPCQDYGNMRAGTGGCGVVAGVPGIGYVAAQEPNSTNCYSETSYDLPACIAPDVYSTVTHDCQTPCADREDMNFAGWGLHSNDVVCFSGCEWVQLSEAAGGGQAALGSTCTTDPSCSGEGYSLLDNTDAGTAGPSQVCRPTDTDGDGIPDVDDEFPNDPNEGSDTDGDGIGDNNDSAPNDPRNGRDTDGEEDGDDEGDNVSEGGGSCNQPPVSTGDGILTQIAFQTWKTRCAMEAVTDGGALKVKGTGTGGSITVGGGTSGGGSCDPYTDANCKPKYFDGSEGDGNGAGVDGWADEGDGFTADESGFGLSRSCPAPPTITIAGQTRTLDTSGLCDLAGIIGALVLVMAFAHALYVVGQS